MLFDLHGKRRRLIQGTYLILAILLGGGLVLFGIGSDVQGGLASIFTEGEESADPVIEDRIADAEAQLETDPEDAEALAELVRANFQLATSTQDPEQADPRLQAAADAWQRYLDAVDEPDDSLAFLMTQVYAGLDDPEQALAAARVVAEQRESTQGFLVLAQFAALAGDAAETTRAGERALALAPESQREQVERQVQALEMAASQPAVEPPGEAPAPPTGGGAQQDGSGEPGAGGEPPGGGSAPPDDGG